MSHAVFVLFALLTSLLMRGSPLTDDQISYWWKAQKLMDPRSVTPPWEPSETFQRLLAWVYGITGDVTASFVLIYAVTALLYLYAMSWCMEYFLKQKRAAVWISVISLVPSYTLGMTYWGFTGFEYVKARILVMPLAPVVFRLFYQWKNDKRIWIPLLLCALGGFLNYEILYLAVILCVVALSGVGVTDRVPVYRLRVLWGITACLAVAFCTVYYSTIVSSCFHVSFSWDIVHDSYSRVREAWERSIAQLSDAQYTRLYWEAAYSGFWWGMFPPRFLDIGFASINILFVLVFAVRGMRIQRREDKRAFYRILVFIAAAVAVAYGYQFFRFVCWKAWGSEPRILEETRAFKYVYLPVYLWAGMHLADCLRKGKRAAAVVSVCLMFASPLWIVRSLPEKVRCAVALTGAKVLRGKPQTEYLRKSLGLPLHDSEEMHDLVAALEADKPSKGGFVLSTLHEIKLAGKPVIISYQDKRSPPPSYFKRLKPRTALTVYWYVAYREIAKAFEDRDPDAIMSLAAKYGCEYIVSDTELNSPRWEKRYAGKNFRLYRLRIGGA